MTKLFAFIMVLIFITATPTTLQGQNVGIGVPVPVAKLDIAGNIKIADGTQGGGKVLTCDASGLASWTAPNSSLLQYNYSQANGNGIETTSSTFTRLGTFVYRGSTTDGSFSQFMALMYTTNPAASYVVRLFDVTHSTVIGVSTPNNTGTLINPDVVSVTSFSNIPATLSVFEIQVLRSGFGGAAGILSFQLFK